MATFNSYVKGVRSCVQSTWHLVLQYVQDDIIQEMGLRREIRNEYTSLLSR